MGTLLLVYCLKATSMEHHRSFSVCQYDSKEECFEYIARGITEHEDYEFKFSCEPQRLETLEIAEAITG